MTSRFLKIVSCTFCFSLLAVLSVVGLTSIVLGFVGLGLYIPTYVNCQVYSGSTCSILKHEYDECNQDSGASQNTCYSIMWFVAYSLTTTASDRYIFSTITETYQASTKALSRLNDYQDGTDHTCFYHTINTSTVQWDKPTPFQPYFIIMVVGFSLSGVFFIVIGVVTAYRCRTRKD